MNELSQPDQIENYSLNRAARRLLVGERKAVFKGRFPLSEMILERLLFWNGPWSHEARIQQRLVRLGEAETPAQFAEALRPFLGSRAWDPAQAEMDGLPVFDSEHLYAYTPQDLEEEVEACETSDDLLDVLAGQEAWTYRMMT